MELTRPGCAVVYVILLCALAHGGSEGKREEEDGFSRHANVFSSFFHVHGEQADVVWKQCRKELTELDNGAKDFDFHALEEGEGDMRSMFLLENNINKATKSLPPHMINTFLDCIRIRSSPPAPVSKKEASLRNLLPSGHRRYLISYPHFHEDLSILPDEFKSSSPPPPLPQPTPPSSFPPLPQPTPPPPPPALRLQTDAPIASPPGSNGNGKTPSTVIFACAFTGIIVVIGMALCYRKVKGRQAENDNMPLIILTSKHHSGGLPKVSGAGNVDPKEGNGITNENNTSKVRSSSIKAEDSNKISVVEIKSSEAVGQVPAPPAPPAAKPAPPPPAPLPPPVPRLPAHAPQPPPPPRAGYPPPAPPKPMAGTNKLGPKQDGSSDGDAQKTKMKPFFWDKVAAKPGQSMVWHEIHSGSFVFDEGKMASLFGCTNQNRNERKKDSPSLEPTVQYIQIIDPKKAQNLSILLKALNVTTEKVTDALKEGKEIPVELCQTLLKMAPTSEEELKLRLFTGDLSALSPAERFLKVLVDIPFAFKRLESLIFMFSLQEEATSIKECFATLEVACHKLRKSRLFLKLLEAVLKTGNRMNDGTYRGGAQAFRLDTLLKLSDVKGTDGKTTLLHFVVQEIIRSEGIRAMRTLKESGSISSVKTEDCAEDGEESIENYRSLGLQVVSGLSTELDDVKRAASIDGDQLSGAVTKLSFSLTKSQEFLNTDLINIEEESEFKRSMERFIEKAKSEVEWLVDEEKRIMALVKSTGDYFHGNAGKDEGLRLFLIVRDFLIILQKVCKEVEDTTKKAAKSSSHSRESASSSVPSSPDTRQQNSPATEMHRRLFPAIVRRRVDDDSSSDDDDDFK